MANKRKTGDAPEWARELLKSLGAKSDFQKRAISGEDFGKYNDFGQSEKQKPSVPKKPNIKPESKAEDKPKNDYAAKIAGYYDEYNEAIAKAERENKDKTPAKRYDALSDEEKREYYRKHNSSALDRVRANKKPGQSGKSTSAQETRNKIGENMAKIASGDGKTNADLKLMGQINKLKREYQWEEAGRRYDALSDEEKRERYRKRNSSALDRARMQEVPGGSTAQETRTNIGENIKDRYYELEDELSDPTKGGEYAFINRVRSAAGETAENIGKWLYDNFGYEPGKEVYEKGEARKIGEIASGQFANEMATNPTKSYQTAVRVSDSLANMLSYKIATGPISLFAGSIASEAAFGKELAKGASYEAAAKIAAEKGSHMANSIFSGGMAFGTFGDTYNQSRAEGQGKLESTIRATTAGAISYITEAMGGIGGAKSPLNKLESAAKQKWITNLLYNAFEEGGEELVEYSLNYLTQGVIDLAAQGKWNQVYDLNVALDNAKNGFWSGGIVGLGNVTLSGGQQVVNKLGNNTYTGNAETDAKLDRAKTELLDNLTTGYQASQDPVVKAKIESQLDATIPDTVQQAPTSPAESVSPVAGNVQAETQTQQEAPAQTEQEAPKKKPSKKEVKHEEMLDQLDVLASERKAQEKAAAGTQQNTESAALPQQKNTQGTARKADSKTINKAYKNYADGNTSAIKKTRFENLYNEAYNAESFEAFKEKHNKMGQKLSDIMQKAYENGHRAEIKAENSALFNDGLIMDEGDRYMLKSRKDIDSLIERYKKAAEDGVVPIETDSENYYDQFRELSAEESQKYSEAAAKLEKYRDEHFAADKKSVSTEKKPANTEEKTVSTESSTDKKKKRIESVIRNLEMLKQKLENGDMAKLEHKNPDKYSEIMFKFEQQTADKNGSDYLGSAEDVSVLIDKYKTDLEMLEAENSAQSENVGAQTENAAKTQQNEYSPEYQNGAEHPETVGAMESDPMNITRAINENGALPQKKKPFSDFDRYKADNNIPSGERAALARKINDPMLGEITVAQNIANLAKDGAKFIEQDGKYYAQNKESSVRVSKSAYNYGKWLNDNGVFYTLNQNAEVPKKINGKYVSKSVTTFIASRGGTDAMVKAIAAKIESGETGYVYDKKSHKEALRYAQDTIVDKGFDGAVEYFNEMALGDHKYTSEINALGLMLKNIASEAYMDSKGKNKDALDLATQIQAWIATNQTNAGQVTESMKIDRQLINENSEMYYQSLIESLQEKYKKRLKGKEITLDAELLRKVAETAGTKEGTKWADKLNASIANQIPATFLERFNAYRYFCMLSSFRTDAKNIISNDIQFVMAIQKNLWLSAAERIYKKKHPEYMLTTSGFKTDISKAKFASEVFGKENTGGSKYENKENWVRANRTNTFQGNGKLNKINIPGRILDFMANTKTKMLSAEDAAAKKALFVNRFVQVMEANHWTVEFLSDKSNPEAIKAYEKATSIAMEEALKGTFNDQSTMVQLLTQWKNIDTKSSDTTFAAGKVAVATFIETMFPFKNVPFNIAGSAIRYSPLGLFAGVCDLKKVKNGNLDARVALENISKGMTGTTVSLGGTLLAMLGMLTLGRDEDEDKPIEEKKDTTMYLKIPDKKNGDLYIDIDWIDSVSMQLRTGLELYDIFKQKIKGKSGKESEEEIADFWGTAIGLATRGMDSFMDIGMMASFSNLLLNKSGARTFGDVFTNQVTNLETQLIPRIVTDIRQALDKEKRNTYYKDKTGKDSEYPKWIQWVTSIVPQSARNQYIAAFGKREKLPARLDEWGNSLGEENVFKRAAEALIVPSKTYRANDDRVQQMLDQLDAKTDKNVFPPDYPKFITVNGEKVNLSGKEYEEVARNIGKERYKLLAELGKDREFQKLSPDKKAELIQDCYNIANEMAKYGFDDDYAISRITQDVKDAKEEKLSISKYLRAKQAYDNMSEYEKDGVRISRSYQLADYLMNDTSTTVEEDIKIIELIERKKDKGEYKSPFENIRKVPDTSDKEMLSLYVAFRDQADKEDDLQSYMLEYGYNSEQALARYNVAKGSKATYDSLGTTQKKKADKLLAAANKGRTANEWNEEKITLAASAVTSIGDFGTKKTLKSYIAMLMAVDFTESEAKEFYKYYA